MKDGNSVELLSAAAILADHDRALVVWEQGESEAGGEPDGLRGCIASHHFSNFKLWALEDEARRRDVDDSYIASIKRGIDEWNQRRNDLVESIDQGLLGLLPLPGDSAQRHSETAGMMIDRLSILALKVSNMRALAQGDDELARECAAKLELLEEQRDDLAACLDALMEDCLAGRRYFKLYRQFKAYNDVRLNPYLSGRGS